MALLLPIRYESQVTTIPPRLPPRGALNYTNSLLRHMKRQVPSPLPRNPDSNHNPQILPNHHPEPEPQPRPHPHPSHTHTIPIAPTPPHTTRQPTLRSTASRLSPEMESLWNFMAARGEGMGNLGLGGSSKEWWNVPMLREEERTLREGEKMWSPPSLRRLLRQGGRW